MKRYSKGFSTLEVMIVVLFIFGVTGWIMNIVKLTECDFEKPYKAEVIHVLGVVSPIGAVTGWLNVGK